MKYIYIIGGTMGVGKTTTCQSLKNKLPNSVFLDGDWCWDMHPFQVTQETKKMVMENICFLLNQFIRCSAYENIIFCWVMHEQAIIDEILLKLETGNCLVRTISLICDADILVRVRQFIVYSGFRVIGFQWYPCIITFFHKLRYQFLCSIRLSINCTIASHASINVISTEYSKFF